MTTTASTTPKVKLTKATEEWEALYDYIVLMNGSKYVYLRKTGVRRLGGTQRREEVRHPLEYPQGHSEVADQEIQRRR